jgi:hypothetical protein
MDVHRAARVAGVAHGGQVVLTDATSRLIASALPDGARLDDLGQHQLKDLAVPEHLFQLTADGATASSHRCAAWVPPRVSPYNPRPCWGGTRFWPGSWHCWPLPTLG